VIDGDEAREAIAQAARRTTARRDLERHDRFSEISPEVGVLDDGAFGDLMDDDLDEALTLLVDMATATDAELRAQARALAARIIVDLAKSGGAARRGIGRLSSRRASVAEGDVDLDASLESISAARAAGEPVSLDELTVRSWVRPDTAVCLLVDRSGSMRGERLAAAALAAAAVVYRHPHHSAVVAFSGTAVVAKAIDEERHGDDLADDVLQLRGHGVTDLGLAARTAQAQLERSKAARRITLLLSDARSTSGGDPTEDAAALRSLGELVILAPSSDTEDAAALAAATGARLIALEGPGDVPRAIAEALG